MSNPYLQLVQKQKPMTAADLRRYSTLTPRERNEFLRRLYREKDHWQKCPLRKFTFPLKLGLLIRNRVINEMRWFLDSHHMRYTVQTYPGLLTSMYRITVHIGLDDWEHLPALADLGDQLLDHLTD